MFKNALTSKNTLTANGALSNSSSGSMVLDYFAKAGSYRNRSQNDVTLDMHRIWGENPELALRTIFYNRAVTRKPKTFAKVSEQSHSGQGNKDEFIKSIKWLEENHPLVLYGNLWAIPAFGCWKDLWYYSATTGVNHFVDVKQVARLVKRYIRLGDSGLIAKYLPKLRSKSNRKNARHEALHNWTMSFCSAMKWTTKDYRNFKTKPEHTAHLFQRQMSDGDWESIDINTIPGKALTLLSKAGKKGVSTLEKHGLGAKLLEYVQANTKTTKFTGYPFELMDSAKKASTLVQKETVNAQFNSLIARAEDSVNPELLNKGVLCALDTSGSMTSVVAGKFTAYDICVSLGVYFSSLLKGEFADTVVMFDSTSRILKLKGSFVDKVNQITRASTAWGSTNFQSVIDEIVRVRNQNPNIPVSDYPGVLLVVSDMQFNPSHSYSYSRNVVSEKTNYDAAMAKLQAVGLPKMTVIWWQVNGSYAKDVPSTMNDEGTVLVSGFDPSVVTTILGGETVVDETTGEKRKATPYEVMEKCLSQELLLELKV